MRRMSFLASICLAISTTALGPGSALAENVASFTGATIHPQNNPLAVVTLDIDPNNPPNDATSYSIPPHSIVVLTISGTRAAAGGVLLHALDRDNFADDELDDRWSGGGAAGAPFVQQMYIGCYGFEVGGLELSGEQSAEVYVIDGSLRIPADRVLPGGLVRFSHWSIDCDKETYQTLDAQGGQIDTPWGDSLSVPPGALVAPTQIRMANMYPLLAVEAVPRGFSPISEAQTLEPDALALQQAASLTFVYTDEEVGEGSNETSLRVFRYDSASTRWLALSGASVDPDQNRLSISIDSLGTYGFAAAAPPALPVPATSLGVLVLGALGVLAAVARLRRSARRTLSRSAGPE